MKVVTLLEADEADEADATELKTTNYIILYIDSLTFSLDFG